jgi:hypothetical protein
MMAIMPRCANHGREDCFAEDCGREHVRRITRRWARYAKAAEPAPQPVAEATITAHHACLFCGGLTDHVHSAEVFSRDIKWRREQYEMAAARIAELTAEKAELVKFAKVVGRDALVPDRCGTCMKFVTVCDAYLACHGISARALLARLKGGG